MNFSKLLLVISLFSFAIQIPLQAAGLAYKPAALMAAASTASAVLVNGVIAIADSIKKEKLFELSAKVVELSNQNDALSLDNDHLQRLNVELKDCLTYARNQVKEQFPFEIIAIAGLGACVLFCVALSGLSESAAPQDISASDKEELALKA